MNVVFSSITTMNISKFPTDVFPILCCLVSLHPFLFRFAMHFWVSRSQHMAHSAAEDSRTYCSWVTNGSGTGLTHVP